MWYGSTKSSLESIVRGLKNEPPQNDAEWQAQTYPLQACLTEMVEMSEPTVNPTRIHRLQRWPENPQFIAEYRSASLVWLLWRSGGFRQPKGKQKRE
jgi:hypothetical protein